MNKIKDFKIKDSTALIISIIICLWLIYLSVYPSIIGGLMFFSFIGLTQLILIYVFRNDKKTKTEYTIKNVNLTSEPEQIQQSPTPEKTVDGTIKEGSIVWVRSSNMAIHCGKVESVDFENKCACVHNFDAWSNWTCSFDVIVRVGVSYYTDEYRDWMSRR